MRQPRQDDRPAIRPVLPLVPIDIATGEQKSIHFTFVPEQDNMAALIAAWQTGGLLPPTRSRTA